jgi:predicted Fe-Mo cluster-binding NifX family protein
VIICVPVDGGSVGPHWGRAPQVAIAKVEDGQIASWDEYDVGWDVSHDLPNHGSHHANIARFLLGQQVTVVVAGGMGPPMVNMLEKMGIDVWLQASGDARECVAAVVAATKQEAEGR